MTTEQRSAFAHSFPLALLRRLLLDQLNSALVWGRIDHGTGKIAMDLVDEYVCR